MKWSILKVRPRIELFDRPKRPPKPMNTTKRSLALVAGASAVLAASTFGSTPAKAQLQNMLLQGIQAPGAGINVGTDAMVKGTLQYTNSAGSNDSFSVGTSTSISSNASASSTSDYAVTSDANFAMGNNGANCAGTCGGLTTINQQIGTSGANSSSKMSEIDRAASASRSAELTASTEVDKSFKTSHNGQSGWWWWGNNKWNNTTEQEYTSKRTAAYNSAYDSAYSSSFAALTEASGQSGTISGSFVKDAGTTTSSVTDTYSFTDSGGVAVDGTIVFNNDDNNVTFTADADSAKVTNSSLNRVTTFEQDRVSSNDVTVNGIGADNNIVAADTANFTTEINKTGTTSTDSGTASGSAGGAVNTTASASASSSTFINSFVQAY